MTEEQDQRIANLLRAVAPPSRDLMFRLRVLERREERTFQRRVYTILAGLIVIALLATFAVRIEGGTPVMRGLLAVAAACLSAWFAFRGQLRQILKRFSF